MDPETYRQLQRLLEEAEQYLRAVQTITVAQTGAVAQAGAMAQADSAAQAGSMTQQPMPADPIAPLGLVFTCNLCDEEGGGEVPLCPNGSERAVTAKSYHEYVRLYAQLRLNRCKSACLAVRRGLLFMLESAREAVTLLSPEDFWLLVNGEAAGRVDAEQVYRRLNFVDSRRSGEPAVASSTTIANFSHLFRAVLAEMDAELLSSFVVFSTGSAGLPADPETKIRVQVVDYSDALPVAHSCFMSVVVPLYGNEAMLKEKLELAIKTDTFELN
jgi:hypothetical protein